MNPSLFQHMRRNINAYNGLTVARERNREPPCPAAEIQTTLGLKFPVKLLSGCFYSPRYIAFARREELPQRICGEIGLPEAISREDSVVGIGFSKIFPGAIRIEYWHQGTCLLNAL